MSTFISMEQFNVKWKIRQESIFHNSMLGCCCSHCQHIHTVYLRTDDWNYPKLHFISPLSSPSVQKISREWKLIDLIKLWMRPWLKLLCYFILFLFRSSLSLNWRWWELFVCCWRTQIDVEIDFVSTINHLLSLCYLLQPCSSSCCYPFNKKISEKRFSQSFWFVASLIKRWNHHRI